MVCRLFLIAALVALCLGSTYGRDGKLLCSGEPISKLGPDAYKQPITDLSANVWYNKFFKNNLPPSGRPLNVQITFKTMPGSNRAEEIVAGNNPKDGSCLVWKFRDFEIYDNLPCYSEKGTDPESCVDEEWVHFISKPKGSKNTMLFFYYCADADANLKTKCTKYLARCLYDTPYINRNDVLACKKLFYKYNLGELPAEDLGSAYNACNKKAYPSSGGYSP